MSLSFLLEVFSSSARKVRPFIPCLAYTAKLATCVLFLLRKPSQPDLAERSFASRRRPSEHPREKDEIMAGQKCRGRSLSRYTEVDAPILFVAVQMATLANYLGLHLAWHFLERSFPYERIPSCTWDG